MSKKWPAGHFFEFWHSLTGRRAKPSSRPFASVRKVFRRAENDPPPGQSPGIRLQSKGASAPSDATPLWGRCGCADAGLRPPPTLPLWSVAAAPTPGYGPLRHHPSMGALRLRRHRAAAPSEPPLGRLFSGQFRTVRIFSFCPLTRPHGQGLSSRCFEAATHSRPWRKNACCPSVSFPAPVTSAPRPCGTMRRSACSCPPGG